MKKIAVLFVTIIMTVLFVVSASAEDTTIVDSGECGAQGDNVIWTLYDDGELVISGEGEMWQDYYNSGQSPFFNYKDDIKSVVVKNGVTYIAYCAFRDLENMRSAIIGDDVVEIGYYAFENCTNLSDINIPDNVNFIGEGSFRGCTSLSVIDLPDSGADIQTYAFQNTAYYNDLSNWDNGVLYIDNYLIKANENISDTFVISNGTVAVAGSAFTSCHNLKEINMPNSLRVIGEYAFRECIGLKKIVFPEGLTTIGFCAFEECFYLEEVIFPESLEIIQVNCFLYCISLKEVIIPENVRLIGSCGFAFSYFMDDIYIKSMNATIDSGYALNVSDIIIKDISKKKFVDLFVNLYINNDEESQVELMKHIEFITDLEQPEVYPSTIYAHPGSTAEKYATELNSPFVPTHFYEGAWIYDSENKNFYRQCIHCQEREIYEELGDIEFEAPLIPGFDFTVDVVEDYVIIEEALENSVEDNWEIIKAFDITMTGKDGVHVQPDGTVKVKLPNDWSKNGVYKVYRVNDDGTLTDMNAYRQGSHLVFDTDHFSIYVIVVEGAEADAPTEPDAPEIPETPEEENKGDFFSKIFDLIKAFIDLLFSFINR